MIRTEDSRFCERSGCDPNDLKCRKDVMQRVKNYLVPTEKVKKELSSSQSLNMKHGGLDQVAGLDHVKALHDINLKELINLARMTEDYSSSDLSVVINESLMRPVKRCLKAEYLKPALADGKSAETSSNLIRWRRFLSAPNATTLEALKTSGRDYKLVSCNRNLDTSIPEKLVSATNVV